MINAELIAELRGHIREVPLTLLHDAADTLEAAEKRIAELEAVDVVPVVHGEWIETEMGYDDYAWVCTVCGEPWVLNAGTPSENDMNYCPNCGAKMKTVTDCHTLEEGER